VFLAIGVLQWPLLPVMLVLIPLALVLEWRATR
jgi:chromate transporter